MDEPYRVVASKFMKASDNFKLLLVDLPFEGDNVKQNMIESIEVLIDNEGDGMIKGINFREIVPV